MDAFRSADQVLLSGVQGITDLITTPGLINLDFADVKSVMSGAGSALMGIGAARGDNRARDAAEIAIASPLLEASMEGAHGVLLSIYGGSDLGLFEINEAASLVADAAHPDANIIFGAVIDDTLGDEVQGDRDRRRLRQRPAAVQEGRRPPGSGAPSEARAGAADQPPPEHGVGNGRRRDAESAAFRQSGIEPRRPVGTRRRARRARTSSSRPHRPRSRE